MSRRPTTTSENRLPAGSLPFRAVWLADFEFEAPPGERPRPVCLVARELVSGREVRQWRTEMGRQPPYPTGPDSLFVAFYASAELGCHRALDWPMPERILDLFVEFRVCTNGRPPPAGNGLLGALAAFGLDSMAGDEKADMRALIMRGGPWNETERRAILNYCAEDVNALARLLPAMLPHLLAHPQRLGQALLRGRYMASVAKMEWAGVPLDAPTWRHLSARWPDIKSRLIGAVDEGFGVYRGGSFSSARFAAYLGRQRIPWPRLESGALALDDATFRERSKAFPQIAPLHELRTTLGQLRLSDLAVGADGRNRTLLSPFRSKTGRNQPSNSRFVFGPATWLRSLIKPAPGHGLAYVDYSSQEVAIAAALSEDEAMMEACRSGDPYLSFAKQAGLAPAEATKATHGDVRDRCKALVLGTAYGMSAFGLAARIGLPEIYARDLLDAHKRAYPRFWRWSQAVIDHTLLRGHLPTVFGWTLHIGPDVNPRSLMNYPMQANGAEVLRLACCLATEAGLKICAPVHDALLLEAPLERLDEDVARLRECMARASRDVLAGFEIGTDAKLIRWPDRYSDPRGEVMWDRITSILQRIEIEAAGVIPSHR